MCVLDHRNHLYECDFTNIKYHFNLYTPLHYHFQLTHTITLTVIHTSPVVYTPPVHTTTSNKRTPPHEQLYTHHQLCTQVLPLAINTEHHSNGCTHHQLLYTSTLPLPISCVHTTTLPLPINTHHHTKQLYTYHQTQLVVYTLPH